MTTLRLSPITEDVAQAIFANRSAYRRTVGLKALTWGEVSEQTREQYRSMSQAACAAMQGHLTVFGKPGWRERFTQWFHDAAHHVPSSPA